MHKILIINQPSDWLYNGPVKYQNKTASALSTLNSHEPKILSLGRLNPDSAERGNHEA